MDGLPISGHLCVRPGTWTAAELRDLLDEATGVLPNWGNIFNSQPPYITRDSDGPQRRAAYGLKGDKANTPSHAAPSWQDRSTSPLWCRSGLNFLHLPTGIGPPPFATLTFVLP